MLKFFLLVISFTFIFVFPRTSDQVFLERLLWERANPKNPIKNGPYAERVMIKPYGASFNGDYVLMEKRIYRGKEVQYFFHLHLLNERTRAIFSVSGVKRRAEFLKYFRRVYRILPGGMKWKAFTADLTYRDTEFKRTYRVVIVKHPEDYWELEFSLEVLGERILLGRYPIYERVIQKPRIHGIHFFDNERGSGLKFSYKTEVKKNQLRYVEDVLCFHETFGQDLKERILWKKKEFGLSPEQRRMRFLTDEFYDLYGFRKVYKHYTLGGKFSEERVLDNEDPIDLQATPR